MFYFSQGADLSVVSQNGASALHHAAESCDVETVQKLLNKGLNIEQKMKDGRTPLLVAARASGTDVIEFLISQGTN